MAVFHGKKALFKITDSGSTLRDISTNVTDVGFPRTVDTAETSAMGTSDKTYVVGLRDARATLSGVWDNTAATGIDAIMVPLLGQDAPTACQYFPGGSSGAGGTNVQYSFNAYVASYEVTAPIGDRVGWSAELQLSGAVTRTLI